MNNNKLALANDLSELIIKTEKAVNSLEHFIAKESYYSAGGLYGKDENYNLCICEHTDGSGANVILARDLGNTKLLKIILEELKLQLIAYKADYEKL
jgi:hypothetical protein